MQRFCSRLKIWIIRYLYNMWRGMIRYTLLKYNKYNKILGHLLHSNFITVSIKFEIRYLTNVIWWWNFVWLCAIWSFKRNPCLPNHPDAGPASAMLSNIALKLGPCRGPPPPHAPCVLRSALLCYRLFRIWKCDRILSKNASLQNVSWQIQTQAIQMSMTIFSSCGK